ncbi:general transcription factor IIH subunit 1 [Toxorhynchites rutilus septentrionalis]|uniref:general transcription factor IIH subunit 1 n=1 Tax=Toxorhynchites rutilus septentrionalis TaxID=329112 RepID=UPI00247B0720|nr:general transcription factor IIH subunit 1 [Toxorhynchites rutilus septentrionalis]XP_055621632.1 general transcription factor IIH subunit 1 [Toxorhynchites rutilus septentrionalis]XP_055621633.1 general transcription factor IIH subunit 1 [Toxorhynchites rutilus septentrionalis]
MTTTREDVLLQMGEVRFKKGDGTLYVMNERIAWIAEYRDTVAVSHRFQDIKMQKISPEGKPKIQLQVVLHDGNSSTFHFVNRNGAAAQIADRDKVKDLLQQLLPNFKRKIDKELEEKNKVLTENPSLLQLYKDLVITQVLPSDEFWATHAKQYMAKDQTQKQDIGVSGAFLADIKPQTDGCNGLRYNLTTDVIECIFKTYPAVKRKHSEHVPAKLSESEFWTKFFQSHYFHRDRIAAGTKDIFTECGKIDDQQLKLAVQENLGDPLLDIRSFEDNTLEDGFCNATSSKQTVNSGNIVHQSMIKRFNQHSFMVLKTCTDVKTLNRGIGAILNATPTTAPALNGDANGTKDKSKDNGLNCNNNNNGFSKKDKKAHENNHIVNGTSNGNHVSTLPSGPEEPFVEPSIKRARILEKIHYDDLEDDSDSSKAPKLLNLTRIERYLHGPVPSTGVSSSGFHDTQTDNGLHDLDSVNAYILQSTSSWNNRTPHKVLVNATAAVNALGELSPGGALMRGFQEQSLAQLVPPDIEKEIRNLYMSLLELLKHFWKCFPPTTPQLEEQAVRMHETLQRFSMAKLKPFEDRAMRELLPLGASMTQHLNALLQAANQKFATWQERQRRSHR